MDDYEQHYYDYLDAEVRHSLLPQHVFTRLPPAGLSFHPTGGTRGGATPYVPVQQRSDMTTDRKRHVV
jgi:hypothetical protein